MTEDISLPGVSPVLPGLDKQLKGLIFLTVFLLVLIAGVFGYYRFLITKKGVNLTNNTKMNFGFKKIGEAEVNGKKVEIKTFVGIVAKKKGEFLTLRDNEGKGVDFLVTAKTIFMEPKTRDCETGVEGCKKLIKVEDQTLRYEDILEGDLLDVNPVLTDNLLQDGDYYEAGIILLIKKGEN